MSIFVNFFDFSKKPNSTKRPSMPDQSYSCLLIEPCSVVSPVIGIEATNPYGWNYCQIPEFDRYYFVRDWMYDAGIWYAYLECDTLASWKTEIGNSKQYVLRSASAWDPFIMDTLYPMNGTISHEQTSVDSAWSSALEAGTYVVGIINSDSANQGAVSYYAFTHNQFKTLCSYLLGSPQTYLAIDEISENLQKALFNPFQYIVSCKWFPFNVGGADVRSLDFGWWFFEDCPCKRVTSTKKVEVYNITIPKHPQSAARGNFCNLSPYSKYTLFFQAWGSIPLDNGFLSVANNLNCSVNVDIVSGIGILRILSGDATEFAQYPAQVGVDIQIAQVNNNPLQMVTTAVSAVTGAVSSFFGGDVVGSIANGISSVADATRPQIQVSGANGSTVAYFMKPTLTAEFFNLAEEDIAHFGKPYCGSAKINTFSGYILCENAEIATNATADEKRRIAEFMNGGFFYE